MQQLKGGAGFNPQANKAKDKSDPALGPARPPGSPPPGSALDRWRGKTNRYPPAKGSAGQKGKKASSTTAAACPIGRFAAACGAEGRNRQGPGGAGSCRRCWRCGISSAASCRVEVGLGGRGVCQPACGVSGVCAAAEWVGHRLRLAHKEEESGTKQRSLSENPGVRSTPPFPKKSMYPPPSSFHSIQARPGEENGLACLGQCRTGMRVCVCECDEKRKKKKWIPER